MERNILVQFNRKTEIKFRDPKTKKLEWYAAEVMPKERVDYFKEILWASDRSLCLLCTDGEQAIIEIDTILDIEQILWNNREVLYPHRDHEPFQAQHSKRNQRR